MILVSKNLHIKLIITTLFSWSILSTACSPNEDYKTLLQDNELLINANGQLTDIIVHDIFSPPVASRIYAYPAIAAYEAAVLAEPDTYVSLMGQLNESKPLLVSVEGDPELINYHLAALAAYYKVATQLVFLSRT